MIVDGGSVDGTAEQLEAWRAEGLPLRVLTRPGIGIDGTLTRSPVGGKAGWSVVGE